MERPECDLCMFHAFAPFAAFSIFSKAGRDFSSLLFFPRPFLCPHTVHLSTQPNQALAVPRPHCTSPALASHPVRDRFLCQLIFVVAISSYMCYAPEAASSGSATAHITNVQLVCPACPPFQHAYLRTLQMRSPIKPFYEKQRKDGTVREEQILSVALSSFGFLAQGFVVRVLL